MSIDLKHVLRTIFKELENHSIHSEISLDITRANELTIGDLSLDSLDLLQFAMDIEDKLGIEIGAVEIPPETTLQNFAVYLHELMKQTAGP